MQIRALTFVSLTVAMAAAVTGSGAAASGPHDIVLVTRPEFFVSEVSGVGVVEVQRCCHGTNEVTVDAATDGGTATPGQDYTVTERTIRFTSPVESADLEIPLVDDASVEGLETIQVTLSDPTGNVTLGPNQATVTVIDNDGPARMSFSRAATETYENYGRVELIAIRAGDAAPATSIGYATSDETATAGSDYSATSGTIAFEAGQRIKRFDVPVTNDRVQEGREDFTVTLSDPVNGELAEPSSVNVTILDDESPSSDASPPVSYFHQPLHDETYRARQIRDILAFADDYETGVKRVDVALMAKKTNGSCAWFDKKQKGFVRGSCTEKSWMRFRTDETVIYTLPQKLRPSRGPKIRYYKAWSRGIDEIGNVEKNFEPFRNLSRFEVR